MTHLNHDQLSALLDDALGPAERAACDAHLAACEACRAQLAALGSLERDLGSALGHDPGEAYFATFADRVAARIAQPGAAGAAAPAAPRRSPWAWLWSPRGLSFAGGMAALLITAGVAWMRFRSHDDVAGALRAAAPSPVGATARDQAATSPSAAPPAASNEATAPAPQPTAGSSKDERSASERADAVARHAREVKTLPNGESVPVRREVMPPGPAPQAAAPGPANATPPPVTAQMKLQARERAGESPLPAAQPAERTLGSGVNRRLMPPAAAPPAAAPPAPALAPSPAGKQESIAHLSSAGSLAKASPALDELQVREQEARASAAAPDENAPLAVQCGTVRDTRGTPVKGAQIMLFGATTRSARSAPDGSFCLPQAVAGDTLVLMHVGFEPVRMVLGPSTSLAIGLEPVGTLGPRDGGAPGLSMSGGSEPAWKIPPAPVSRAPAPDVYAGESAAVRAAVTSARLRTTIAGRDRSAGAWETASARWDSVATGLAGRPGPAREDARFQALAALHEAWRSAPTPARTERLRAALAAFIAGAPRALPERATAERWQLELMRGPRH